MKSTQAQQLGITHHDLHLMFRGEKEVPKGFRFVTKQAGQMTEDEDSNFAVVTQWNERRSDWHQWSWLEEIN